jgi:hypothetical protein
MVTGDVRVLVLIENSDNLILHHHRFRLWLKVWRGWRSFLILEKVKKTKINLAKQKGNTQNLFPL